MKNSKVINVDENSPAFLANLKRRLKLAKNPKNRISLDKSKQSITAKYHKLANVKV